MPEAQVRQIKIMISGTHEDLAPYWAEARAILRKVADEKQKYAQLVEVSMEKETQSGERESALAVSRRWVAQSDWIVVIVGFNYGTRSVDDVEGRSITECEFAHAAQLKKKIFVFMAGEPRTVDEYHWTEPGEQDLKNWMADQSDDAKKRLRDFRNTLRVAHVTMFASLQAFRDRFADTLRKAVDDLPPGIAPGTPLGELMVSVTPVMRDCIRKVMLIADCKRIHDHLHEIRNHAIRPLREEVLSVWRQEGALSPARETTIWRTVANLSEEIGAIRVLIPSVAPAHQGLQDSVTQVLRRREIWQGAPGSPASRPSLEEFTEHVDDLADAVQAAFSEADRSMGREESDLRDHYRALLDTLGQARQQRNLGEGDQQRLDAELARITANRNAVRSALDRHTAWQQVHDDLEQLDGDRDREDFAKRLGRGTKIAKLRALVEKEIGEATRAAATSPGPGDSGDEDRLTKDVRRIAVALDALMLTPGVAAFDELRKPFDDAFFAIDKHTLREVEEAHHRAVILEGWLDALASAQQVKPWSAR